MLKSYTRGVFVVTTAFWFLLVALRLAAGDLTGAADKAVVGLLFLFGAVISWKQEYP